jgi:hypothetical protein
MERGASGGKDVEEEMMMMMMMIMVVVVVVSRYPESCLTSSTRSGCQIERILQHFADVKSSSLINA